MKVCVAKLDRKPCRLTEISMERVFNLNKMRGIVLRLLNKPLRQEFANEISKLSSVRYSPHMIAGVQIAWPSQELGQYWSTVQKSAREGWCAIWFNFAPNIVICYKMTHACRLRPGCSKQVDGNMSKVSKFDLSSGALIIQCYLSANQNSVVWFNIHCVKSNSELKFSSKCNWNKNKTTFIRSLKFIFSSSGNCTISK